MKFKFGSDIMSKIIEKHMTLEWRHGDTYLLNYSTSYWDWLKDYPNLDLTEKDFHILLYKMVETHLYTTREKYTDYDIINVKLNLCGKYELEFDVDTKLIRYGNVRPLKELDKSLDYKSTLFKILNRGWKSIDKLPNQYDVCNVVFKNGNLMTLQFRYDSPSFNEEDDNLEPYFFSMVEPYFDDKNWNYDHLDERYSIDDVEYWTKVDVPIKEVL